MNTEDYVSYQLALALKKHGFDEPCDHFYYDNGFENDTDMYCLFYKNYNSVRDRCCSAPSLWQAQKWLREVKELIICVEPRFYMGRRPLVGYSFHINEKENRPFTYIESEAPSNTYEEALSAGIVAALELIENNKNN